MAKNNTITKKRKIALVVIAIIVFSVVTNGIDYLEKKTNFPTGIIYALGGLLLLWAIITTIMDVRKGKSLKK